MNMDVLDGDMACLKGFLAQYYPRLLYSSAKLPFHGGVKSVQTRQNE